MASGHEKKDPVLIEIEDYFGFLFDRGYKIRQFKDLPMGDREVTLESSSNCIIISSDRRDLDLAFAPLDTTTRNRIGIRGVIYFLSGGQNFIGRYKKTLFNRRKNRFEDLANLLRLYIDQITPYFGKEFDTYRHELILAGNKYNDLYMDKYISKGKHQE